jgi:acetyl-CoA C-acetyltransferase
VRAKAGRTPVLIGGGQVTWRGAPARTPELSPAGFMAEAGRRALADAGSGPGHAGLIDRVAAVRMTADNRPPGTHPFGTADNVPRAVARRIGSDPREAIYGTIGGQSPQAFVNECAEALHAGQCEMALIVAGEATGLERAARRAGMELDWSEEVGGDCDDRGPGDLKIHPAEVRHGLFMPVLVYSLIEHALRTRLGRSRDEHAHAMAELFAGFSEVAAANPHAQFPVERTPDFLLTESVDNYRVSDPYPKWLVAQDAVSQGAAVLMTTDARADELGIAPEKRVYLHGYATVSDLPLIERADMGASRAAALAAGAAFGMAGWSAEEIGPADIYSCFPCAVTAACEAAGLPASDGARLTVTGGLPYFGGAGNGYSLFAIAEMLGRLRAQPGAKGLITANGGFMSKESVGLYSSERPAEWRPLSASGLDAEAAQGRAEVDMSPAGGTIETFTIAYAKGAPARALIIGRTEAGARFAAASEEAGAIGQMLAVEPIGRRVEVEAGERSNSFRLLS